MNQYAQLPPYQIGDRVLLFDNTVKKGQCRSLSVKYKGPYEIIQILPGYAYKLRHCETNVVIQRPVHANRIKPLRQQVSESPCVIRNDSSTVFDESVGTGHVQIVIDDITKRGEDGIMCFVNDKLQPLGEESKRLHALGGVEVRALLNQATSGNSTPAGVVVTAAAKMNATSLIHTVLIDEYDQDFRNKLMYGLHMADKHVTTIALPFPGIRILETQVWDSAQIVAEVLRSFCMNIDRNGNIKSICVVCNSLLVADVLTAVFRTILTTSVSEGDQIVPKDDMLAAQNSDEALIGEPLTNSDESSESNQWFSIDRILKQRIYKSKPQFLVAWSDQQCPPSWVAKSDVSPDALAYFYQNRKRRRRGRQ
jgi:hypothetical protein